MQALKQFMHSRVYSQHLGAPIVYGPSALDILAARPLLTSPHFPS